MQLQPQCPKRLLQTSTTIQTIEFRFNNHCNPKNYNKQRPIVSFVELCKCHQIKCTQKWVRLGEQQPKQCSNENLGKKEKKRKENNRVIDLKTKHPNSIDTHTHIHPISSHSPIHFPTRFNLRIHLLCLQTLNQVEPTTNVACQNNTIAMLLGRHSKTTNDCTTSNCIAIVEYIVLIRWIFWIWFDLCFCLFLLLLWNEKFVFVFVFLIVCTIDFRYCTAAIEWANGRSGCTIESTYHPKSESFATSAAAAANATAAAVPSPAAASAASADNNTAAIGAGASSYVKK